MTGLELIESVRPLINDSDSLEYDDAEMLGYVNSAITYMSNALIAAKHPIMCEDRLLVNGDTLPDNFVSFVGHYPIYSNNNVVTIHGREEMPVRMYLTKKRIALRDLVPYPDYMIPVLQQLVSIFALNRNEYDVSTDNSILQKLEQVMQAALNG